MRVIDILNQSADILNLTEISALFDSANEENEEMLLANEVVADFYDLLKYSIQELCTNFTPVIECRIIQTEEKKFPISNFTNYIRIHRVYKDKTLIKHKIISRCLQFEEDGEYEIYYESYPTINSLFEEIDFLSDFSPDVLVLGLCSYYTLSRGMFEDFKNFHEEYETKALSLRSLRNVNMPQRRWLWKPKSE